MKITKNFLIPSSERMFIRTDKIFILGILYVYREYLYTQLWWGVRGRRCDEKFTAWKMFNVSRTNNTALATFRLFSISTLNHPMYSVNSVSPRTYHLSLNGWNESHAHFSTIEIYDAFHNCKLHMTDTSRHRGRCRHGFDVITIAFSFHFVS